jgi:hypothetical protein
VQSSNTKQGGPQAGAATVTTVPPPGTGQQEHIQSLQKELKTLADQGIVVTADTVMVNGQQVSPAPAPKAGEPGQQAAVPPSNQPGAGLWESAMQGGIRPAQNAIPMIPGGPQNVVYAPVGSCCSDDLGNWWVKSSDATVNTGWKKPTLA